MAQTKLQRNKVAVGLSGGVDSTAAAYVLKEQGNEVVGVTMILFDEDSRQETLLPSYAEDAQRVAKRLGIEHHIVDLRGFFYKNVRDHFVSEYCKGRTPNPCVVCNKKVKFGKFLEYAHEIGAYYIATGHYANVSYDESTSRYRVFRGKSDRKDQAYVFHSLSQYQLRHVLLPLSDVDSKDEVRKIALAVDHEMAKKTDSTGICFIPGKDHKRYVMENSVQMPAEGVFRHRDGKILGRHKGIPYYTIGQKRGLGVQSQEPLFVTEIDAKSNEVILGSDEDTYSNGFIGVSPNFIPFDRPPMQIRAKVKVCHWGYFLDAVIKRMPNETLEVEFDRPQRAVTPGQSAVFYNGDEVIGGAVIESTI